MQMRTSITARRQPSWLRRLAISTAAAAMLGGSVLLSAAPAEAQTPSKIAVIDVRRAVIETEQGLRVSATLKKLFDSRQVEIEAKQQQLQKDKEKLEKEAQAGKVAKDQLQKKYEQLVKQDAELQKMAMEYQNEMQRRQQEMTTPILNGILEAVKRIAAQDGFDMVLEKSAVPYFRGDLDLTDRAIQMYNAGNTGKAPAKGAAPPAAAPAKPPAAPPPAPPKK